MLPIIILKLMKKNNILSRKEYNMNRIDKKKKKKKIKELKNKNKMKKVRSNFMKTNKKYN